MNGTTEIVKYKNGRLVVLLLFVCSFLPHLQAQNRMAGKPVQIADSVRTVYSGIIYFSLNNGDWIEQSEYKKAGRMLRWALSDTITPIVITGWADESGTAAFNEQLSLRRARTVRNYLVKKGIAPERITFEGCGIDTAAESPEKARRADVQVSEHFSVELPVLWCPWYVSSEHAIKTFTVQPEARYWLSKPGKGHFFGVHAHVGWFNVKWNRDRYQDTDRPLLGAGISYGYLLPFNEHWAGEFTLGAGYANMRYDTYYNIDNGARIDTRTKNYWGITRVGLSVVYRFNLKK